MKLKAGWQKQGLWFLFLLYIILGVVYCIRKVSSPESGTNVEVTGRGIEQEEIQASDKYKEIKKVAITFDDGPHPVYTEQILDGLKERDVKATFFITGEHAEEYPEIVRRIYMEGHIIGNHTYSHLQLTPRNEEIFAEELRETSKVIKEITGEETIFVRPPYGEWDKKFEKDLKMFPVLWTIDPLDWCSSNAAFIVDRVVGNVKDNDIILLHDEYESTKVAVLVIVDRLREKGYEFVTVDEIMFN